MERLCFPMRLFPIEDQQLTGEFTGERGEGVIMMQVEVSGQDPSLLICLVTHRDPSPWRDLNTSPFSPNPGELGTVFPPDGLWGTCPDTKRT